MKKLKSGIYKVLCTLAVLGGGVNLAGATVKPASIFTDHMVLQQQTNVAIWGWGKPSA